jgi:hypothetical protein
MPDKLVFSVRYSNIQLSRKDVDEDTNVDWEWVSRTCPIAHALIDQGYEDVKVLNDKIILDGREIFRPSLSAQEMITAWDYYCRTRERPPNYKQWLGRQLYAVKVGEAADYL